MAIVCGTDFSELATRAATAAALLAARMKQPLHLVYALQVGTHEDSGGYGQALRSWAERQLATEAQRLRRFTGTIEVHTNVGVPDEVVLDVASRVAAKLIVVGPSGERRDRHSLGSHADHIARCSHAPVLVVRAVEPFEAWAEGSKPLRIVLGVDASASSEAALRWVRELRAFGPCDVVAVHLYWPPEQFQRLGLGGVRSYLEPDPEVTRTLEREFFERLANVPDFGPLRYRSEPHLGRIADRLADLATEERADVVVVGSHRSGALARLWEASVSRGVLQCARTSVACVSAPATEPARALPRLSRVLVATDFSAVGDAAVPLAYACAAPGAMIHLIHVVPSRPDPIAPNDILHPVGPSATTQAALLKQLAARVPDDAATRGKTAQLHILESNEPAAAICQTAERLGVDLVCLGTHGRSGMARTLLGSIAQGVLAHCERPVLLARRHTK